MLPCNVVFIEFYVNALYNMPKKYLVIFKLEFSLDNAVSVEGSLLLLLLLNALALKKYSVSFQMEYYLTMLFLSCKIISCFPIGIFSSAVSIEDIANAAWSFENIQSFINWNFLQCCFYRGQLC